MNRTQLEAFLGAFGELWTIKADAQDRLKEAGVPFRQDKWFWIWMVTFWLCIWLISKTDYGWIGWVLIWGPYVWVSQNIERWDVERAARRDLEAVRWREFDIRFQWRAFGMSHASLIDLERCWRPNLGFDYQDEKFQQWWADASQPT